MGDETATEHCDLNSEGQVESRNSELYPLKFIPHMPPNLHIRNLLNEPFGPYPEDDILGDGIRKGTVLDIKSFSMECGRLPIGLVSVD